jgi:hypothetical protein
VAIVDQEKRSGAAIPGRFGAFYHCSIIIRRRGKEGLFCVTAQRAIDLYFLPGSLYLSQSLQRS